MSDLHFEYILEANDSGLTYYVITRRFTDNLPANNTLQICETETTAHWTDYATTLTELPGNGSQYVANQPTWQLSSPSGWTATYYLQAGATPVYTDDPVAVEHINALGLAASGGGEYSCIDISANLNIYQCFPETVTLNQYNSSGNVVSYSIQSRKFPVNEIEGAASNGIYRRWETTYRVPNSVVTEDIQIGETITDTDGTWVITDISKLTFNGGYFLGCVSLTLNGNLDTIVDIYTPVHSNTDAWADDLNVPVATYTNVSCHIQPERQELVIIGEKKGFKKYWNIYTPTDFELPWGTYILSSGIKYILTDQINRQSLKEMNCLKVFTEPFRI